MADQLLSRTYYYRLYGLSVFSNRHAVLRKLKCGRKNGNLEQL